MLALLSDVHGNLAALDAVLEDAAAQGATRHALLGDYCGFGPWPVETLERVEALGAQAVIRGNHDRWVADRHDLPDNPAIASAVDWAVAALGPERCSRLAALPTEATIDGMLLVHASPGSDMRGLAPGGGEDAEEAGLLSAAAAGGVGRVVVGHTHLQFIRATGAGVELVNPGSVGLPWDGDPRAAYALVAADGTVELRRVAYDRERTLAALGALGEPWAAQVAAWVEQARFDARP